LLVDGPHHGPSIHNDIIATTIKISIQIVVKNSIRSVLARSG